MNWFARIPLFLFVLGCAPTQLPPAPSPAASQQPPEPPASPRQGLLSELRGIAPERPLLALDPAVRDELARELAALPAEQRETLLNNDAWAAARPLLHLAADGTRDAAYRGLLSEGTSANLAQLFQRVKLTDASRLVATQVELSQRAARELLHRHAVKLSGDAPLKPGLLVEIHELGTLVGSELLRRQSVELLNETAARPEYRLMLSHELIRAGELQSAQKAYAEATAEPGTRGIQELASEVAEQLRALEALSKPAPGESGLDQSATVQKVRRLLVLDRLDDAQLAVAPLESKAPSNLAVASVLARVQLGGTICPGVPEMLQSATLCSFAWRASPAAGSVTRLLETAWKSGQGRDPESVETYLGVRFVLPWMYGTLVDQTAENPGAAAVERLREFVGAAQQAERVAPEFAGTALFVEALAESVRAGLERKPGERVRMDPAVQDQLYQRALELTKASGSHRFVQAAALGVAAASSQELDISELLAGLPARIDPAHRQTRAVLLSWAAVSQKRKPLAERAGEEFTALLQALPEGSLEGTRLVLLMAEGEVAIQASKDSRQVLLQVAKPILEQDVPLDLKLQAALDVAGVLDAEGRSEVARDLLTEVVTQTQLPATPTKEHELFALAKAYLIVLNARAAPAELEDYRKKLDVVLQEFAPVLGAAAGNWIDLWRGGLAFIEAKERCAGKAWCEKNLWKRVGLDKLDLGSRLGEVGGALASREILATGAMRLSFGFSGPGRLRHVATMEPRFLSLPFPASLDPSRATVDAKPKPAAP